jgi:lysophospholipase L1-like esterase
MIGLEMIIVRCLTNIQLFGDSILKGIQVNPTSKRYYTKNDIDLPMLSERFSLSIQNDSHFGCTVTKGDKILSRKLESGLNFDAVIMDFGGNDCDFNWNEIAANPDGNYQPNTPLPDFILEYRAIIQKLKANGIVPILTTLPPLEPQRFFDWWCQNLNKVNIMKWLGSITAIYSQQEKYSRQVEQLAKEENVPLVDIRGAFLNHGRIDTLMCEDGTHPNSEGQKIITEAFLNFFDSRGQMKMITN